MSNELQKHTQILQNKDLSYDKISPEDVVKYSICTKTNILTSSFDESDEYNSISFSLGVPIKTTILLSTLVGSKRILGNSKFRSVTIPDVNKIKDELKKLLSDIVFEDDKVDVFKNTSQPIDLDFVLNLDKERFIEFIEDLCNKYESNNSKCKDVLFNIHKNTSYKTEKIEILKLSNDLFLMINKINLMEGTLLNKEGLKIIISNYM